MSAVQAKSENRAARLFVTGDTHVGLDAGKLNSKNFPEGRSLTKDDFVVVAGDFGLPWSWPVTRADAYWLEWFGGKPWTALVVDGNHENFDALGRLAIEDWHGGRVQRIRPDIIRLMRGEVYDIAGMSVFAFGGARPTSRSAATHSRKSKARVRPTWTSATRPRIRRSTASLPLALRFPVPIGNGLQAGEWLVMACALQDKRGETVELSPGFDSQIGIQRR